MTEQQEFAFSIMLEGSPATKKTHNDIMVYLDLKSRGTRAGLIAEQLNTSTHNVRSLVKRYNLDDPDLYTRHSAR